MAAEQAGMFAVVPLPPALTGQQKGPLPERQQPGDNVR